MSERHVVAYRALINGEGVSLHDTTRTLQLHRNGEVAHRSAMPLRPGLTLAQALGNYTVARHFPSVLFAHSEPKVLRVSVDIDDALANVNYLPGVLTCDGEAFPWEAHLVRHRIFRDRKPVDAWLPPNVSREAEEGWAFRVPTLLAAGDPVISGRLALALHGLTVDITAGRAVDLPAEFMIGNTFSRRSPPPPALAAPLYDSLPGTRSDFGYTHASAVVTK